MISRASQAMGLVQAVIFATTIEQNANEVANNNNTDNRKVYYIVS